MGDARVVYEDVKVAQLTQHALDEPFHIRDLGNVGWHSQGASATRFDLGGDPFDVFGAPRRQRHIGPSFRQSECKSAPQATPAASHDGDAAGERAIAAYHAGRSNLATRDALIRGSSLVGILEIGRPFLAEGGDPFGGIT
jgi:hypothetical protein